MNESSNRSDLMAPEAEGEGEHEKLLGFLYLCPHGMAEFDAGGDIALINPAAMSLLGGCCPEIGVITNLFAALSPHIPDLSRRLAADARPRGIILDGFRIHTVPAASQALRRKPRSAKPGADPLVISLTILRLSANRLMAVLSDISAAVAQERQLREAEAWFAAVMNAGTDYAYFTLDAEGLIADWNASCERLFGRPAAEVLDEDADLLLVPTSAPRGTTAARLAAAQRGGWQVAEGWMPRTGGEPFWGTSVISVLRGDRPGDPPNAYLVVVRDTTERRSSIEAMRQGLCMDHLTGVLNRRYFLELAEQAFAASARSTQPLSAIMVDADRFKAINDRLGHAAGDAVLIELAAVLKAGIRAGHDHVGRLGGEEFCILLPGSTEAEAAEVADRLRVAVEAARIAVPPSGAGTVRVTASFGVATRGNTMPKLAQLLEDADRALYAAKAGGRNRVTIFEPSLTEA